MTEVQQEMKEKDFLSIFHAVLWILIRCNWPSGSGPVIQGLRIRKKYLRIFSMVVSKVLTVEDPDPYGSEVWERYQF
jgi:hypothetical protein